MNNKSEKFAEEGRALVAKLEDLRARILESCIDEEKDYLDGELTYLVHGMLDAMHLVAVCDFK